MGSIFGKSQPAAQTNSQADVASCCCAPKPRPPCCCPKPPPDPTCKPPPCLTPCDTACNIRYQQRPFTPFDACAERPDPLLEQLKLLGFSLAALAFLYSIYSNFGEGSEAPPPDDDVAPPPAAEGE